ncbi:MAG: tRNA pseudouridine(55) synthase TruB [Clostridia bacterium]|nr:tRNA pseudouridine(55) synthase TruB [Clostridia bacterium]
MQSGIIVINKPKDLTSQAVVSRVKHLFGEKKAGHTGTLDPMATGVLPVLLGRAVKASDYMLTSDKYYRATLTLGLKTDTEDATGTVLYTHAGDIPDEDEVRRVIGAFVGKIKQTPPMYSAIKMGGKKLCDLARAGVTVEREAREITVHSIEVTRIDEKNYSLDVHCQKGTYIRTLCHDIGEALGVGGIMSALLRTRASIFTLEDAYTLDELEAMTPDERAGAILPTERVFEDYAKVTLPDFFARLASSGCPIYLRKIGIRLDLGTKVRLYRAGEFFAIGECRELDGEPVIKPTKQFLI